MKADQRLELRIYYIYAIVIMLLNYLFISLKIYVDILKRVPCLKNCVSQDVKCCDYGV